MHILFITSTYLGDAILSTGLLQTVLKKNPNAKITVACGPIAAPIFKHLPNLEKLIIIEKKKFSLHWVSLWLKTFFCLWDFVIDVRGTGIAFLLPAKKRKVWQSSKTERLKVHQIAAWFGLSKTPLNHIWTGKQHVAEAKKLLHPKHTYIAFSPAANWDKKCWPLTHFVSLAQKILKNPKTFPNPKFLILGTASQREEVDTLFQGLTEKHTINLMGKVDLLTLAECLKKCQLFVGNDSGLMHLAAACGTPTLGLFGPSPVKVYGPWGQKTQTVSLNEPLSHTFKRVEKGENVMKDLSVEKVYNASKTLI